MKKLLVFLIVALLFLMSNIGFAQDLPMARDLVASLGQVPGLADTPEKGTLVDIVKAIDEIYPGKIKIEVYPLVRSINNVIEGRADFHMPKIKYPHVSEEKLPYSYVSEKTGDVSYVLYSNKDKIITKKMIDDVQAKNIQNPYVIEVLAGSESNYSFKVITTVSFEQSLQKVQNKRIDVLLWPQEEADQSIKNLKLNMIRREYWGEFEDRIMIPKGHKGEELDKIFTECLKKLKASGRLQELYKKVHLPYNDWQPS